MEHIPTRVVDIRKDAYDVYIGRAGHGQDGYFGNPFPLPKNATEADRRKCFQDFRWYFQERIEKDPEFRRRVLELQGKRLGCFCAPKGGLTAEDRPYICHGQLIASWLDDDGTEREDYRT